jgi:hypothetical protein
MAVPYSRKMLIQRIKKHINDGYANDAWSTSDNELMLYIDQAIAFGIVGQAWNNAKLAGVMEVPEAYLITYLLLNLTQDPILMDWYAKLPQPPVSLPLGYSINEVYSATTALGKGINFLPIKSKRQGYREFMPFPSGGSYRVENGTIRLKSNDGYPLLNIPIYVQMPTSRTSDITQDMNLPDDVIQVIFDTVVQRLIQRYSQPKDIVHDDLPAGNTSLRS